MRRLLPFSALTLLHLRTSRVPLCQKGVVVVQIDGLGAAVLQEAIRRGFAPFLASLIPKNRYVLEKYLCPVPTITTAVEAELMYGTHDGVVGYSWFDRKLGHFVRGDEGGQMRAVESHAFSHIKNPLLKHGSCIAGGWSGGATMVNFSAEALADKHGLHRLVKFRAMLIPLLNPIRFWAILGLLLRTSIMATLTAITRGWKKRFVETMTETLLRIFLSDVSTSLGQIELLRETPALFINYPLVDVLSHKHGTRHPLVFDAIRLIDFYCRKIYESAGKAARDYHVIFLSDHGQSDSIPFTSLNLETLCHLVDRGIEGSGFVARFTYGNNETLVANKESNTVFIVPSSSIAHLYISAFLCSSCTRHHIQKQFPKLIPLLMGHPGIGWILLREGEARQTLIGKKGRAMFRAGKLVSEKGIVIDTPDHKRILAALAAFAAEENNGDIVIFGAVSRTGKSVTFEPYQGTHGGFTGEMIEPFLMTNHPQLIRDLSSHASMQTLFARIRSIRT